MSDRRIRLIDVPVVDSAVNRALVDISFQRVNEVLSVRAESFARRLVS